MAWAWPCNRRILWTGHDVPDAIADRPPDYVPEEGATGPDALGGQDPFIMRSDGKSWIYVPVGLADGPLPAHYEPPESVLPNPLYRQQNNPVREECNHPARPLSRRCPVCCAG